MTLLPQRRVRLCDQQRLVRNRYVLVSKLRLEQYLHDTTLHVEIVCCPTIRDQYLRAPTLVHISLHIPLAVYVATCNVLQLSTS